MSLNEMCVFQLWAGVSVPAAGTTLTSGTIDLGHAMNELGGTTNCAMQYYVQGNGATIQLTYDMSLDGKNFIRPIGYKLSTLGMGNPGVTIAHNSGRDSDGRDILPFVLYIRAPLIRFHVWDCQSVGATLEMFFAVK